MPRGTVNLDAIKADVEKTAKRSARKVFDAEQELNAVKARIQKLQLRLNDPENDGAGLEKDFADAKAADDANQDALEKLGGERITYTPAVAETAETSETPAETETAPESDATVAAQLQDAAEPEAETSGRKVRRGNR